MTRTSRLAIFLCVLAGSGALIVGQRGPTDADVGPLVQQLGLPTWEQRSTAFYQLTAIGARGNPSLRVAPAVAALRRDVPQQADALALGLARALDAENRVVQQSASLNETFTDYYGDLVTAVTSLRDPRSAGALSGAMSTGHLAVQTLASFGQASLDPVLARLRTDGGVAKQAACIVLGLLLDPANPASIKDPAARARIKDALESAARDAAGAYVRAAAVEGLAKVGDQQVVALLLDLARSDSYDASSLTGQPGSFPVRQAALTALRDLGQNRTGATGAEALNALRALAGTDDAKGGSAAEVAKDVLKRWRLGGKPAGQEQKPPKPPGGGAVE